MYPFQNATMSTRVRTVVLIISLINVILNSFGKNPLPFSDEQIYNAASMVETAVISLITWWKNNSFTVEAVRADEILKELKNKK